MKIPTLFQGGPIGMTTVPVIENSVNGLFLTESPSKLLEEGRFNKVPVISGVTSDEGILFLKSKQKKSGHSSVVKHYL